MFCMDTTYKIYDAFESVWRTPTSISFRTFSKKGVCIKNKN